MGKSLVMTKGNAIGVEVSSYRYRERNAYGTKDAKHQKIEKIYKKNCLEV